MRYVIPDSVLRATLDAEEVLLNTSTGQYHLLNRTGRLVVERLQAGGTAEEAVSELVQTTGAPVDDVQADVQSFLDALRARGLLETVP